MWTRIRQALTRLLGGSWNIRRADTRSAEARRRFEQLSKALDEEARTRDENTLTILERAMQETIEDGHHSKDHGS